MTVDDLRPLAETLHTLTTEITTPLHDYATALTDAHVCVEADVETALPWTRLAWTRLGGDYALALVAAGDPPRAMSDWSRAEALVAARACPALTEALQAALQAELATIRAAQTA